MSNEWIELGLSRPADPLREMAPPPPAAPPTDPVRARAGTLVVDLLGVIGDMAPDGTGLETDAFRATLAELGPRIGADLQGLTPQVADECVRCCHDFLARAKAHLSEREAEFSELVALLTEMVQTLSGAGTFNDQLDRSAERLHKMVDINDIRILKRRLAVEIQTLKRLSTEKRTEDTSHRSYFSSEIERLQVRLAHSMEEASIDQLTRVANRGRFERTLQHWVRAQRTAGRPFVLVMIDVDDFKQINDRFGHQEGDRMLVEVARMLSAAVRPTDLVARYGGDEFVILLADTTATQAQSRMADLLHSLSELPIGPVEAPVQASLSIGLTEWSVEDEMTDIVNRADTAMYEAKRTGKGRLEIRRRPARSKLFQNGRPVIAAPPGAELPVTDVPRRKAG